MANDIARRDDNYVPAMLGVDENTGEVRAIKTNADGELLVTGTASIAPDSSVQKIIVSKNGTDVGERQEVNLIEGSNVTLTVTDNAVDNRVDVTVAASSSGVSDGDKGDITVSGSGATWTIDSDVVTYDKMQDTTATDVILGRETAGGGTIEEIACTAAGRAILDDADASAQRTTLGSGAVGDNLFTASTANAAQQAMDTEVGVDVQAYDALLDDISTLGGNGIITRVDANTAAARTITAGDGIDVTNGDGVSGNPTITAETATDSNAGISELATAAEVTTGTDTGRTITPDALAGSTYGTAFVELQPFLATTTVAVGDLAGGVVFRVPAELNGWNLVSVGACVMTAGTTGTTDIQIRNITQAADMLSTKITIDSTELDSKDATAPPVIDTGNDDVATGDQIRIDVDAVSTTPPLGLVCTLGFRLP